MKFDYDIAIIGAGAAGLTAAIFARAAAPEARIVAIEAAPRIGAKILISGGGRCNVTNHVVTAADFNGNRNAIAKVLRTFSVAQTVEWFESLGVSLVREETAKLFPVTNQARTVVDALLRACEGVELRTASRVTALVREPGGFALTTSELIIRADRVVLCAGGKSVPKTGSDGSGYSLVTAMGHSVTEVFPALVPLILQPGHWLTKLSGTSANVEVWVRNGSGKTVVRLNGSMLCTHFGLSGPVILDISRHWIEARRSDPAASLAINFVPGESFESLDAAMVSEAKRNPRQTAASFLRGRMPERIAAAIAFDSRPLSQIAREDRRRIARAAVETIAPVERDRGFDYAEVTAGGVPLSEVDLASMESRRQKGLFLCGEILDVDGRIGGFNFQWAWSSGRLAGIASARRIPVQ